MEPISLDDVFSHALVTKDHVPSLRAHLQKILENGETIFDCDWRANYSPDLYIITDRRILIISPYQMDDSRVLAWLDRGYLFKDLADEVIYIPGKPGMFLTREAEIRVRSTVSGRGDLTIQAIAGRDKSRLQKFANNLQSAISQWRVQSTHLSATDLRGVRESTSRDLAAKLKDLHNLLQMGGLTQEEYELAKRKVLKE